MQFINVGLHVHKAVYRVKKIKIACTHGACNIKYTEIERDDQRCIDMPQLLFLL